MRPFRFGLQVVSPRSREDWTAIGRKAESLGFDVLTTADHVGPRSPTPLLPLVTVAEATEHLRVGTLVLNNDLHHPALLAREAAMLDVLTEGRFELGLGAGHMRSEYEAIGIPFDDGATRVERLEESVAVITSIWREPAPRIHGRHHRVEGELLHPLPVQEPHPPLLVAGNGRRLLSLAGRQATIVGLAGLTAAGGGIRIDGFDRDGCRQRIGWARDAAGDRFDQLELNVLVQHVERTTDREAAAHRLADRFGDAVAAEELLDSPYVLIGDDETLVDGLVALREELGVSYVTVFEPAVDEIAPVVARLAGT